MSRRHGAPGGPVPAGRAPEGHAPDPKDAGSRGLSPVARRRAARLVAFAAGIALLYAPVALLARALAWAAPSLAVGSTTLDVHTACVRMPIQGVAQPWFFTLVGGNPLYLLAFALPATALFFGPLFCGWLCPAGHLTEHLSRVVPRSLKVDLSGLPLAALRYGFLIGFLAAPWISSSICCSLCNFTPMQGIVSAATGDMRPLAYWSSTGIVTAATWLVFLGVLTEGGRGWCTTLCPTGAVQSLAHAAGARLGWSRSVRHESGSCADCRTCQDICPPRAIAAEAGDVRIDPHLCNTCLECTAACPEGALTYERRAARRDG